MKVFLLNISKSNSKELLMIGIVLARYSSSPIIYGTVDPCELFNELFTYLNVPQYRIVAYLKLKFYQEGIFFFFRQGREYTSKTLLILF